MPQPTMTQTHIDALLTNMSVAYLQNTGVYIATRVFPIVPVEKKSDKYFTYTKADWYRDEAQRRADATESVGGGFNMSTSSYSCDVWAFHKDVGDQVRANSDAPHNPDATATEFVTRRLLLRLERQWASDCFTTSVWAKDYTGVSGTPSTDQFTQWSDYGASDPIGDMETAKRQILATTGYMPNTLVLGYDVWRYLQHHPDIIDRYKYTTNDVITEAMIAKVFGIERILVASSIYSTSIEGTTTPLYDFVHGKAALLCYVAPAPALLTASAGYTFVWRGISPAGTPIAMSRFRMDKLKADRIEGEMAFDNKVVATDLGCFFTTAVA